MKKSLWSRNFTLVTAATALGAIGGIAGSFGLSFLVFDETGSTLAAALIIAIQLLPYTILPLLAAPWMDRLPRKPFLVGGDLINGVLYALAGLYLLYFEFSYIGYLCFSLLLASIESLDQLAYESIYPKLIPEGMEQKGYTVSSMLYPILKVLMTPIGAVLFDTFGVAKLLLLQSFMSVAAAAIESRIRIHEESRMNGLRFSLRLWWSDTKEAARYLKQERGLQAIYSYMAVTNGVSTAYSPLLVAFFRTAPGFSVAMYSFFSVVEFIGRSIGGLFLYRKEIPKKKKFGFAFGVYQTYELMDMCLLWLPYPAMLVNRGICGFLGIQSATLRQGAVQCYIPEQLRARVNAFQGILIMAAGSLLSLLVGLLGEAVDYRLCMTICGSVTMTVCWLTVWRQRKAVRAIYEYEPEAE